jgi:presenilin-like A22 family membrane protease
VTYIINTVPHQEFFWRRCRGKRRLLQGEFRTHILYFVYCFAFTLFLLALFYKNTKKIVSFIVVFTCLLLALLE